MIPGSTTNTEYAIRFDMPKMSWTDVRTDITEAVAPLSANARMLVGTISSLTGGFADHVDIPSGGSTDFRCLTNVGVADEPAADTKFSNLPSS